MQSQLLKYSDHYETLAALVTYLAVCNRYSEKFDKTIDNATPQWLAKFLGLEEKEVATVLDGYKSLFRKSVEEYAGQCRYSLLLRYARRPYTESGKEDVSVPLSNAQLFPLLNFISNKVKEEQEDKWHTASLRQQQLATFIAMLSAIIAAVAAVVAAIVR